MSSYQYIYMMKDLTTAYQAGREVLNNITLAFLPGAKIGVLGYNGAGKSTLLKIMAASRQSLTARPGRQRVRPSDTCRRNRSSTPRRRLRRTCCKGWPSKRVTSTASKKSVWLGEVEDADEMTLIDKQNCKKDRRGRRVGSGSNDRNCDGCAPLPARRGKRREPFGRRAAPDCALPIAAQQAGLAPGRANKSPRCRNRCLLERHLREYEGTVVMVTHDRYFLDNVTGWILELDRGRASTKATIPLGWSRKRNASSKGRTNRRDCAHWRASGNGSTPVRGHAKPSPGAR